MNNRKQAVAILSSLNQLVAETALSSQRVAEIIEMAMDQNRDITEDEMAVIRDERIENQPKHQDAVMRNMIYGV
jgi:hypothetical protein